MPQRYTVGQPPLVGQGVLGGLQRTIARSIARWVRPQDGPIPPVLTATALLPPAYRMYEYSWAQLQLNVLGNSLEGLHTLPPPEKKDKVDLVMSLAGSPVCMETAGSILNELSLASTPAHGSHHDDPQVISWITNGLVSQGDHRFLVSLFPHFRESIQQALVIEAAQGATIGADTLAYFLANPLLGLLWDDSGRFLRIIAGTYDKDPDLKVLLEMTKTYHHGYTSRLLANDDGADALVSFVCSSASPEVSAKIIDLLCDKDAPSICSKIPVEKFAQILSHASEHKPVSQALDDFLKNNYNLWCQIMSAIEKHELGSLIDRSPSAQRVLVGNLVDWFKDEAGGAREAWCRQAPAVEARLSDTTPLTAAERKSLFPPRFQEASLLYNRYCGVSKLLSPHDLDTAFRDEGDIPLTTHWDIIKIAYYFLMEEGFHIETQNNAAVPTQRLEMFKWQNPDQTSKVQEILNAFVHYRDRVVRPRFPQLGEDVLAQYLMFTVTPEFLQKIVEVHQEPAGLATGLGIGDRFQVWNRRIRIEREIASGGMGVVYEGTWDPDHYYPGAPRGKPAAVKLFRSTSADDFEDRLLFHREGQILGHLRDTEGVVQIHCDPYIETDCNALLMVLEYLPYRSLTDAMLARGIPNSSFAMKWVLGLAVRMGQVIRRIHDKGVVHLDLKPDNILIDDSGGNPDSMNVKIIDFGIAEIIGHAKADSAPRGTPGYASVQRFRMEPVTYQDDVYAFGAVLYWMFTGAVLVSSSNQLLFAPTRVVTQLPPQMQTKIIRLNNRPAPEPNTLNPNISTGINKIIVRALQTDRQNRHQSMEELLADLSGELNKL